MGRSRDRMPTIVATTPTGGSSRPAWVDAQFSALALELDRRGVPPDLARPVAAWITCLHWLESGEGSAEWNYNAGNVACTGDLDPPGALGWHGDCARVGRGTERAYESRRDAVADWLDLQTGPRYRAAFAWLLEHPSDGAGWYQRMQAAGYSAPSTENVSLLVRLAGNFARVRGQ